MRKNIFIALGLIIFSNAAFAERVWTGPYGGLNGGVIFNNVKLNANQLGFSDPSGNCNADANFSSFFPGVQIGYARQLDSKIVWGAEGDYTAHLNQATTLNCTCPSNNDVSDQFKFSNKQQASIRFRLGYALRENLLPFLSVGGSVAHLGLQYSNEAGDHYAAQTAKLGWLVGAGIEWKFLGNWSLRADYYYTDYGKVNLNLPTIYGLYDSNGAASARLKTSTVRAAINYWFL